MTKSTDLTKLLVVNSSVESSSMREQLPPQIPPVIGSDHHGNSTPLQIMAAKTVITIAGGVPAALQQAPSFIKWLQSKAKGSDAIASLARKVESDSEWPSFTGGSLSYDEYIAYRSRIRTCAVFDVRSIDEFELAWELYSVETAV